MKNLENILSHSDCLSQERMQLYLENKLDKKETHALESHITDCMFCSDALDGLMTVTPEEAQRDIADIKSQMEALIGDTEHEEKAIVDTTPPSLQANKGGKRISWVAAAGLFFLIFAGGMVVFSYINNNTNWFNQQNEQLSKTEKGAPKGSDNTEHSVGTPELGEYTIEADGLAEEELPIVAKEDIKFRKNTESPPIANRPKRDQKEAIASNDARAEKIADLAPPKPLPVITEKQKTTEPALGSSQLKNKRKEEIVAKADAYEGNNELRFKDLSKQNTYSQPKYEGKLKDINQAPAVSRVERKVKKKSNSSYDLSEDREIDAIQSQGLKKVSSSYGNLDNYAAGNTAFGKGDYKQSIKYYKRALRQKEVKNRDEILYQLAMAYEKNNNQSKAEKIYTELERKAPYKSRALNGLKRVRSVK